MTSHILVSPFSETLLHQVRKHSLVLRIHAFEDIRRAVQDAKRFEIQIHCLLVQTRIPLASIPFQDDWKDTAIALYTPSLGRFRDFFRQLPTLRRLNIRIYLPADSEESYTHARVLASLGIDAAIVFEGRKPQWDMAADLMTYALLGLVPHASIEPFHYIAARYRPTERSDFGAVYFEDPSRYLHLDEKGRVALSQKDLAAGKFIAQNVAELAGIHQCAGYRMHADEWRSTFLQEDGCAYCQAWRVCLGKFKNGSNDDQGCKRFFSELMDVVEQHQALKTKTKAKATWQP